MWRDFRGFDLLLTYFKKITRMLNQLKKYLFSITYLFTFFKNNIKTLQYDYSRIIGIEVQSNDFRLLFLTVYLPYECDMHYHDYCIYLSKLQCNIDFAHTPYIIILGDFNADI